MKKKIFLAAAVVILFAFFVVSQDVPNEANQAAAPKVQPLTLQVKITGWVFSVNCTDHCIEIVDVNCKKYKVNVKPNECNSWHLKYGDLVLVKGFKNLKDGSINATSVTKIVPPYLIGTIKTLNCTDSYIIVSLCNGIIEARVNVRRDVCNQYRQGQKIRVTGTFNWTMTGGLIISNAVITAI